MLNLKIKQIIEDNETFRTYIFEHKLDSKPGQFVMVWVPGVDEIPISVGWEDERGFKIGIAKVGDCTGYLFDKIKEGDRLGIRGPFGKGFELKNYKNIVLIGGGAGVPPMLRLAQIAVEKKIKVTAIIGARNKDLLIYEKDFKKLGCEVLVSTDDGSKGHKGYNTHILEEVLKKGKTECIYSCGPEMMMYRVADIARHYKIPCQLSLERYMKCGFGICGQCCIDGTGLRVCKDGPVFDSEIALQHKEFGKYKRTSSGKRVNL